MRRRLAGFVEGIVRTYQLEQLEQRRLLTGSAMVYVDANVAIPGNGSSWATAYNSLAAALTNTTFSGTNNQIFVAAGTYAPTPALNNTFTLQSGLSIIGGYLGGTTANANTRSSSTASILSGSGGGVQHVVTASLVGNTAVLDGFTITGGSAITGNGVGAEGGGIYSLNGAATIQNCIIRGNTAKAGGGVFSSITGSSTMTLANCLITGNTAMGGVSVGTPPNVVALGGGGVESVGGNVLIENCTFSGNSALPGHGGAVDVDSTTSAAMLENSIFWNDIGGEINPNPSIPSGPLVVVVQNCDVSGGYTFSFNSINASPNFTTDFHLQAGTMCIDHGSNAFIPSGLTTDLDFSPRINNGTVDMGAYEFHVAAPTLLYVDSSSPASQAMQDGSSWSTAYHDLQAALGAGGSGTTIEVAQGTYLPTSGTSQTITFQLKSGEKVYGGYGGYSDTGHEDSRGFSTFLSGALGGNPSVFSYHVVTLAGTDSTTVLDGVLIEHGSATGTGTNDEGGGIYVNNGAGTISNCNITQCVASLYGAGLYSTGTAALSVSTTIFSNNTAQGGSGIYAGAPITIFDCIIEQNVGATGAGLYLTNANSSIDATFFGDDDTNTSSGSGGAVELLASVAFTRCTFQQNSAVLGGAVNVFGCTASFSDCTFDGNFAAGDVSSVPGTGEGGAVYVSNGIASFIACAFVGNTATGTNSSQGGAIYGVSSSSISLYNCTLTDNSAAEGGAIDATTTPVVVDNSILWNDSAANGSEIFDGVSDSITINYSDVSSGGVEVQNLNPTNTMNISADPVFIFAPSAGSDGVFGTADDDYGALQLQATSPAIDVGQNSLYNAVSGNLLDLKGEPRFFDFPGVNDPGATIDMGAYEANLAFTITGKSFELNTNPSDVKFVFSANVYMPQAAAVTIDPVNADGSLDTAHPVTATSATYTSGNTTVTFALPTSLADGNYRATLAPGSVATPAGLPLLSPSSVDFFVLAGDANHDRTVNALDLNALATNFGKSGMNFSGGDFDYSGVVGIGDFNLLAGNFGKMLAAPPPSAPFVAAAYVAPAGQLGRSLFANEPIGASLLGVLDSRGTGATII